MKLYSGGRQLLVFGIMNVEFSHPRGSGYAEGAEYAGLQAAKTIGGPKRRRQTAAALPRTRAAASGSLKLPRQELDSSQWERAANFLLCRISRISMERASRACRGALRRGN